MYLSAVSRLQGHTFQINEVGRGDSNKNRYDLVPGNIIIPSKVFLEIKIFHMERLNYYDHELLSVSCLALYKTSINTMSCILNSKH